MRLDRALLRTVNGMNAGQPPHRDIGPRAVEHSSMQRAPVGKPELGTSQTPPWRCPRRLLRGRTRQLGMSRDNIRRVDNVEVFNNASPGELRRS
jgi:hypothetical protein